MFNQTIPPDDFVLVCDGELGNDLNEIISQFEISHPGIFNVVRLEKCGGLGNALNVGMKYCKYELIARMDSDDISLPDRCCLQLAKFDEDKELDIVSGTVLEFWNSVDNIRTKRELPANNEEIYEYAKKRSPFNHAAVMFKKSVVKAAGGYQDFPFFEDYYLWLRMLRNNVKAYNVKQPIYLELI